MPTDFKNVSEITQQVIGIVQANSNLKDVWIQGRISEVSRAKNGFLNFTLTDNNEKIQCVIFNDRESLQENLPEAGSNVFVKGEIWVYGKRSEYRFMVTEVKLPEYPPESQPISINDLTETLRNTLKAHSSEVQGEIFRVFGTPANYTILKLKNITVDGQFDDILECTLPPEVDPPFPIETGKRVRVSGRLEIFAKASAYRIKISDASNIEQVTEQPTQVQTTSNECPNCGQRCEDSYQLCSICHYAQVDHEGIVVGAVTRYFDTPKFASFSTQREYKICFGSGGRIIGRADIALLNSEGNPVAIAECKHIGYDGNDGIVQLKNYINPTVAKLGLFADDTDPYEWIFLKRNYEKSRYDQISRYQFERELGVDPGPGIPPNQTCLELIHGNIIETEVDAIATTASAQLARVAGVDGEIRKAAGEEVDRECQEIIEREGFRPQGHVEITTGGKLTAKHIIHAIGPIFAGGKQHEAETLACCYENSLKVAVENGIRSIAFPAISTGDFGYPIEQATPIALNAVKEFVEQAHQNDKMVPERIQFVLFDEEAYNCYVKEFLKLGFGLSCLNRISFSFASA